MKKFVTSLFAILFLLTSGLPAHAQVSGNPLPVVSDVVDTVQDTIGNDERGNNNGKDDEKRNDKSQPPATPSATPEPSASPTPGVIIDLPEIDLPLIGGPDKKEKDTGKQNDDVDDISDEQEIDETDELVQTKNVQPPAPVRERSQRMVTESRERVEERDEPDVVAAVTKPIEPPFTQVRAAVQGTFYANNNLPPDVTRYSLVVSLLMIFSGVLLLNSSRVARIFVRRSGTLKPNKEETFYIPYLGSMYK